MRKPLECATDTPVIAQAPPARVFIGEVSARPAPLYTVAIPFGIGGEPPELPKTYRVYLPVTRK